MISSFGNWASTLRKTSLLLVLSVLLPTLGMSNSVMAAEQVHASYSALDFTISVNALEQYAQTGVIDDELALYRHYLPSQHLEELRRILLTPVKISPVVVAQFLHTSQGEFLLRRLAAAIDNRSLQPQSEFNALRSALISASAEPGGLTLLNLLRKYPSKILYVDLAHSLSIATELERLVKETSQAIATVTKESHIEAAIIQSPSNFANLPDLQRPGKLQLQKQTLKLFDASRQRLLLTDIYLPNLKSPAPVVVISHGLGTDSSNFQYLATHLASHGFAVVVPTHPGSDTKQLRSLSNQKVSEVTAPNEFQDRPLDVKYILDQLEKSNQSEPQLKGRLNLQQVGVFGQSLGGYTALALAGGQINFEQLAQDCQPQALDNTWNMSLLLQCRALALRNSKDAQNYNFRDERVKAAIAVNPITSSIFGKTGLSQIQIPVMLVGSSDDTVAPALFEQILPFSWFANSHKYLVMLVGATHFSTIGNSNSDTDTEPTGLDSQIIGDNPAQARRYMNALSLPFFHTHVTGASQYNPYLSANYAKTISSQPLSLSFVESLSGTEIAQALDTDVKAGKPAKKRSPNSIVNFGFWMLDVGVALLHVMIFL